MPENPWSGVFAAILCPFRRDEGIDQAGLRTYAEELANVAGLRGLVVNGHTGEVASLLDAERAEVTGAVVGCVAGRGAVAQVSNLCGSTVGAVAGRVKVISGVLAEGSAAAIAAARAARDAGADAILLMPPHHWLRFGRSGETAVGFVRDVAEAVDVPIVLHQYPAWTKACYSLAEMLQIVKVPRVVAIKMGTRDMGRWGHDYRVLKAQAPAVAVLSCHDEYLLATLLEGADGALVGFAGLVPELIVELAASALRGDLAAAQAAQEKVRPLARIVYRFGEPSGEAHQRMKCARWLMGKFPSPQVRRPLRPLPEAEVDRVRRELNEAGFRTVR